MKQCGILNFYPEDRILAGAGTGLYVTYYTVSVIPNPPDSRGGIMGKLNPDDRNNGSRRRSGALIFHLFGQGIKG